MQDPVSGSAAVLVKKYNITEQKELELKLAQQQEALQKSVYSFEQHLRPACCQQNPSCSCSNSN